MAANKKDISDWFDLGVKEGATHMIVVCDTFDWEDYPVYVESGQSARKVSEEYNGIDMQKIMECYNLKMDKETQMNQDRAFNWD